MENITNQLLGYAEHQIRRFRKNLSNLCDGLGYLPQERPDDPEDGQPQLSKEDNRVFEEGRDGGPDEREAWATKAAASRMKSRKSLGKVPGPRPVASSKRIPWRGMALTILSGRPSVTSWSVTTVKAPFVDLSGPCRRV